MPEGVRADMSAWIPFPISAYEEIEGSVLDMAWLLDPPAGCHGFLTVQGDRFVFEDGTPARFWGGNFFGEANFPEPEEARKLAGIVARSGANVVRLHHLDVVAPWTDKIVKRSLFGGQAPVTTRRLDPVMLDKFDYLVKCLKDRGIYIFLSPVSSRFVRPGDGFPGDSAGFRDLAQGLKLEGMFDHLRDVLLKIGFIDPQNPEHWMLNIRRFLSRIPLRAREVRVIRGICRQMDWYAEQLKQAKRRESSPERRDRDAPPS